MAADENEIKTFDELLELFVESGNDKQLLGTESEKFGVQEGSGTPVSYDGKRCGVLAIFEKLSAAGWTPVREREDGPAIAVERRAQFGHQQVSLEPGGQLELSGGAVTSVHEVALEIDDHLSQLAPISKECGMRWLSTGYHPLATQAQLPWVPKERYRVMRRYFPQVGSRGLDMMRRTATVQVNLDYRDERDAMRKMRVALKLSPVATAIFANSPFSEGKVNGLRSERAQVWLDTDPHRTGLLAPLLKESAGFVDYAEWALDVPMYLFKRAGEVIANTGQTFRSFMADGFEGHRARRSDWRMHLNTLFPEVRLQKTIEVRSADALPVALMASVPALWAGLLYDEQALADCERLVAGLDIDALEAARPEVARLGLAAELGGAPIRRTADKMIELSLQGLSRRNMLNAEGDDEAVHLHAIADLVAQGRCPADVLLQGLGDEPLSVEEIVKRTSIG